MSVTNYTWKHLNDSKPLILIFDYHFLFPLIWIIGFPWTDLLNIDFEKRNNHFSSPLNTHHLIFIGKP